MAGDRSAPAHLLYHPAGAGVGATIRAVPGDLEWLGGLREQEQALVAAWLIGLR